MSNVVLQTASKTLPPRMSIPDQPAHLGGEGSVYFAHDGLHVVKTYHKPAPGKGQLLEKIVRLGFHLSSDERKVLAWPVGSVKSINNRPCVGVVTQRAPLQSVPLVKLILPEAALREFRSGLSWLDLVKIARATASAIGAVHEKGVVHADIHFRNILADPTSGEAVLIDLDGLVVDGFLPPQVDGMFGFMAPEIVLGKSRPCEISDRYSLAVLILHTLLLRNAMQPLVCYDDQDERNDQALGFGRHACFSEHPSDKRNRPAAAGVPFFRGGQLSYRALTPRLQRLCEDALVDGLRDPSRRPSARDWENALADAYDSVLTCQHCNQSYIYPYWIQQVARRCPFCGIGARSPQPTLLRLIEPSASPNEHARYGRMLVLTHGSPLFPDVFEPHTFPPFTRRTVQPIGQAAWSSNEGVFKLVNLSARTWRVATEAFDHGNAIPLKKGLILKFGTGSRMAEVIE